MGWQMRVHKDYYAYSLIQEDYLKLTEFVHPHEDNFNVFSHRIYELLLRTCTEIENVLREQLAKHQTDLGIELTDKPKIHDYKKLIERKVVDRSLRCTVGLQFWSHPNVLWINPFQDWFNGDASLFWYRAYNNVKHNREANFPEANFKNLTYAFAALFQLHETFNGWAFFQPYTQRRSQGGGPGGYSCEGCIFSISEPRFEAAP